jgi:hypothetical protein
MVQLALLTGRSTPHLSEALCRVAQPHPLHHPQLVRPDLNWSLESCRVPVSPGTKADSPDLAVLTLYPERSDTGERFNQLSNTATSHKSRLHET